MIPMAVALCFSSLIAYADFEHAEVTNVFSKKTYVLNDGKDYSEVKLGPIVSVKSLQHFITHLSPKDLNPYQSR
jgi:hypothetical protein